MANTRFCASLLILAVVGDLCKRSNKTGKRERERKKERRKKKKEEKERKNKAVYTAKDASSLVLIVKNGTFACRPGDRG